MNGPWPLRRSGAVLLDSNGPPFAPWPRCSAHWAVRRAAARMFGPLQRAECGPRPVARNRGAQGNSGAGAPRAFGSVTVMSDGVRASDLRLACALSSLRKLCSMRWRSVQSLYLDS